MTKLTVVGWKLIGRVYNSDRKLKLTGAVPVLLALIVAINLCLGFGMVHPAVAAADPLTTVNFQGRLQRNSGVNVDASSYNIEFKLYNSASGGNALWTEDYLNSANQGVSVDTTGYFSVKLGSITPFPANMNWDQQLWVTMNIGGITTTVTWDGEMNPRLELAAVPYAFQAGQLTTQTGSNTSTLSWANQTASNTLLLPNESGTLCVSGDSTGCGFVAGNSSGFIQNTTTPQTNTNFNIDGNGTIGGSLTFSGQNAAITGSSGDLGITAQGGNVVLSSLTGSVIAKAGGSSSSNDTTPTFAVQSANSVNLLAAYTGVGLIKIGIGIPTLSSSGLGDLYVSGNGEFGTSLRVGGSQNGLNFVAGSAPSSSNGLYTGTSRPVRTVTEMPAFNGMTADSDAKGSLTTGFDTTNGAFRNYYNWTTSDSNAQSENMYVQIAVPRDFSALTNNDQICYNVYTDDTSGNSGINATFYDTTNTAQTTANITPNAANQWQRMCTTNIGGTITVDGNTYVTVLINLTAAQNRNVRLGSFSFDYLGAF